MKTSFILFILFICLKRLKHKLKLIINKHYRSFYTDSKVYRSRVFEMLLLNIQNSKMQPDPTDDILGPKKRNYQFLQLVRDKKYAQALIIGQTILKESPNNPSVQKFVDFIQKNAKKLDTMVKEEEEYESVHSSDDSDEQQEREEGEQNDKEEKDQKSSDQGQDEQDEEEEEEKPDKQIELTTCTLNQIPHVCPRHHKLIIEAAAKGEV